MATEFDRMFEKVSEMHTAVLAIERRLAAGITITLHHEADASVHAKLNTIINQGAAMSGELDTLTARVAANNTLIGSAITLLQGLKAALDAAIAANDSGDPTKLAALSESLGTTDAALAAAIVANTPHPVGTAVPLADAQVGVAYTQPLAQPQGPAPFSFVVSTGSLPDGLTLDSSNGVITGTPTTAGDSAFTVTVADSDADTADDVRSYTIHVV